MILAGIGVAAVDDHACGHTGSAKQHLSKGYVFSAIVRALRTASQHKMAKRIACGDCHHDPALTVDPHECVAA